MRAFAISAARALVATLVVVLVVDALIGVFTGALSTVGGGPDAPWWLTGHLVERTRWVVFGLLLVAAARVGPLVALLDAPPSAAAAWRLVGALAVAVPLLWLAAFWVVQATIFTAFDRWDVDGQVYLAADYYRRVVAGYAPWLLGGVACLMASRHIE
ncbi:MAG: hypothetical protein U0P30_05550 [Vicinamibacterales bacterium]